jgi:hypothetical protein
MTDEMIAAGAKAMVQLCQKHQADGKSLPSRIEEARVCIEAALRSAPAGDAVREALLIENAPEALKQLGSRLADLLDADHWNNIEPLLLDLAAASAMSVELERSPAKLVERERIEQILRVHFWMGEPGQPAAIKVATAAILALIEQPGEKS